MCEKDYVTFDDIYRIIFIFLFMVLSFTFAINILINQDILEHYLSDISYVIIIGSSVIYFFMGLISFLILISYKTFKEMILK